ncbi:ParB/RepB/Spo0J family partition protein [Acidisoma cellulosilytica]|uniref:ParB/RepB/Spo0J family partition protein n=1 Tax=Acidisoma cellulosilyticum TaxID=2802395 RepID=A0A963Z543_9PROT|nr:ParB/RepB/Spo0J family partition protein [Acidisoma cellulosilyticum]MCB8882711.1 ParB/RepB/Spo0J family partition protein [Acidisoma cellulosilyticum]
MALGNKGFAAGLAGGSPPAGKLPPRTGVLQNRGNRLAELASGQTLTREHELVDPALCRVWEFHNRDYGALNEESCADLIESFRAQGRQEVPAIVRRVLGDPACQFEIICGARRHWTASWLRANDAPNFRFLVEPRELSDEEAFRIADLENRSRQDLSDVERARDYAGALTRYYGGNQARMAERLSVSQSWLSRYLDLAAFPATVISAFGSLHAIKISHGATLAPLLRHPLSQVAVIAEAQLVAEEQSERAQAKQPVIPAPDVVKRLQQATRRKDAARVTARAVEFAVRAPSGALLARGTRPQRGSNIVISVPRNATADREQLLAAINEVLDKLTQG